MWKTLRRLASFAVHSLEILLLFTYSDYKTIFFPVSVFAWVAAPAHSFTRLLWTELWIWLHLIQANVSNQTFSGHEDIINKPWRPIPSGKVTVLQARALRWTMMVMCLALSLNFGMQPFYASLALSVVEIVHDDFDLSGHPVFKNLCNVGGYLTFELGATLILSSSSLDSTARLALVYSNSIIFTTIHAQDFADVPGDTRSGRRTLPIIAPGASRHIMLYALLGWSFLLSTVWKLGPLCRVIFVMLGFQVGIRYFCLRTVQDDQFSYVLYNVWLMTAHIIPTNVRTGLFSW